MTSPAGHLVSTARAATLDGAGRTTRHLPRQASVFCRSRPELVALLRTVGRPHRSAVKVGRKLEKRTHSGVHHWRTRAALLPCYGRQTSDYGKEQSAKPGTDAAPLVFGSPAISPGLSRPLGLGWFAARPVRLTPESPLTTGPSQEAPHQCRHSSVGHLVAAPPQRRHLRSSRS